MQRTFMPRVLFPFELALRVVCVFLPVGFALVAYAPVFPGGTVLIRTVQRSFGGRPMEALRSFLDRVVEMISPYALKDPRDTLFIHVILWCSLLLIPSAIHLYFLDKFSYAFAALHVALVLGPRALMIRLIFASIHQECHRARGIFKPRFRIFDRYITWILGPLIGEMPEIDRAGHAGIHHSEVYTGGDMFDLSSDFHRASFWDFSSFVVRRKFWYQAGFGIAYYCWKHGLHKHLQRVLIGMLYYYGMIGVLLVINWKVTVVVFVVPFVFCLWFISIINWAQHAFVDPRDPANPYKGSTTLFDPDDIFAEGYHMSHHLHPTRHYTEHSRDFEIHQTDYGSRGAFLFDGLSWFDVWVLLMRKDFAQLAQYYVSINGTTDTPAIIALLENRIAPTHSIPAARRLAF